MKNSWKNISLEMKNEKKVVDGSATRDTVNKNLKVN